MKKLGIIKLKEFRKLDNLEMRKIVGGGGYDGPTCTVSLNCSGGNKSCTGETCYSTHDPYLGVITSIECIKNGISTGKIVCTGNGYA